MITGTPSTYREIKYLNTMTVNKTFSNTLKMKSAGPFVQKYFNASSHYMSQLRHSTDRIKSYQTASWRIMPISI